MLCRSKDRGESAQKAIMEKTKSDKIHLHICDLGRPHEIVALAKKFRDENIPLDVLINNAGVMLEKETQTPEGIDTTFATNTLSNYILTEELIPVLRKGKNPRVIIVSSGGMLTEPLLVREKYAHHKKAWLGRTAYARTKRHQLVLVEEFAKKYKDDGILFASVHPGWADTPSVQDAMPGFYEKLKPKLRSGEQGADCIFWLAVTLNLTLEKDSGEFFRDRRHEIKHFCISKTKYKPENATEFMRWVTEEAEKAIAKGSSTAAVTEGKDKAEA